MTLYEKTIKRSSALEENESLMEAYNKILMNEAKIMTVSEFVDSLEKAIKKIFPKSLVIVKASKNLGSSIDFTFALGKDKSEFANGIIQNDPLLHKFTIGWNSFTEDRFIKDKIEVEAIQGGILTVMPEEGSHMAYGRVKLGFRKKTAPPEGIIKHLDNYFKKVKKILKDNMDNLTDEDRELAKKKI